ncbi:MAG: His/Gly/Thr/Pro-type tRNA ligase C-terminal domain-containing protein, partial [Armatimonadota bacterium]
PTARHGVFVVALGDAAWLESLKLVQELRLAGVRADADYRRRSMKAQLRFADNESFAQAVIMGENEIASGILGLKNLENGEQVEVPRVELLERLTP